MALIRAISIKNFRCIQKLEWLPNPEINCLVGPGDTGKSSVIDAIDFCIGARRALQISDKDFYRMDVSKSIEISIVIGALEDNLKNFDSYGLYLRGFNLKTGELVEEPEKGLDTTLVVKLKIEDDLEPQWSLVSPRAEAQGQSRSLSWKDRLALSPTRLGAATDQHLGWRKGSLLHKLSEERADASGALTQAARNVRISFGDQASQQLTKTLGIVLATATNLGVEIGDKAQALIDSAAISFNGGTVSLHDQHNVPLSQLGLGSTRLLIAGLQREAAQNVSMILIDELEHGLEPHRLIRLLDALGAKTSPSKLQVFMTTHSPVVVRELSGDQLMILRCVNEEHVVKPAGLNDAVQGAIRTFPEALLAPKILVCEGASEVGLVRGLNQHRADIGERSLLANGVALVDGGGDTAIGRALAFQILGYRVALFLDNDLDGKADMRIKNAQMLKFKDAGGKIFIWRDGLALEDELFTSLPDSAVEHLLDFALERREESVMNDQIKTKSGNAKTWNSVYSELLIEGKFSPDTRVILGRASRHKESKKSWYKSLGAMEKVGKEIVGPDLDNAEQAFKDVISAIFKWTSNATS